MQSSVLQTSSRSHRENTRRGRWSPVATFTISASQLALSYVAEQIWPLILNWPVYAQISSIWGQKGGKGEYYCSTAFKGNDQAGGYLHYVAKCWENQKGEREGCLLSKNAAARTARARGWSQFDGPHPFQHDHCWGLQLNAIFKLCLLRWKIVDKLWIPLPSCFLPSTEHFGESPCAKSHNTHLKLCAQIY